MKKLITLLFLINILFVNAQTGLLNGTGYAPNFTVTDLNGNSHELYNYLDSGYVTVLEFLSVTCGHCVMHAPGTLRGDQSEYKAIQKLFGKELPHIISTKYTTGHTFGASGALSMELAILMLQHQKTIKLPYESEPCGNPETLKNIMVNATGFGGNAVSIILSK